MNDADKAIWIILSRSDSFSERFILLKYNENYRYKEKANQEFVNESLMKFFINGLIEPINQSLDEWQLTKAGKFVKDNFTLLIDGRNK